MGWHAVEAVDDAVDATRRFLFPFHLVRWAKLAFLVLLMGSGANAGVSVPAAPDARLGGMSGFTSDLGTGTETEAGAAELDAVVSDILAGMPSDWQIVAVAAVTVVAVIGLSVVSLSLRLVFYDALRTNEVRLWRPFFGRLRQAVGLFVASVVLWSVAAGPIALAVIVAVAFETPTGWEPIDSLAATVGSLSIGPAIGVGLLVSVVILGATLALRFTYEFVVPAMVITESGVIAGWRRSWRAVSGEWPELAVYIVVHFFVGLGTAFLEGVALTIASVTIVAVAGSALLLAAVLFGGLSALVSTTAGIVSVLIVVLLAIAALVVLTLPVSVVTRSYMIAYEVATLAAFDPELRLLDPDIDPNSFDRGSASTDRD
ncbi:DUF7544 domain-containing protein [Halorubrum sp. N11]|uniref:DUF7544 domain-containing protein n=1 Tax=Halorubrum sp. N11 TaxID=3402276 RepID=UPI003EBD7237